MKYLISVKMIEYGASVSATDDQKHFYNPAQIILQQALTGSNATADGERENTIK